MVKQNSWLESGCLATRTTMFLAWPYGLIFFFKTLIIAGDYPVVWISDSLCVFVRLFCLTDSSQLAFTSPLCREDTLDHLPSLFGPAQNGGPQVVDNCSRKQKSIINSFLKWRRMGCWWAGKTLITQFKDTATRFRCWSGLSEEGEDWGVQLWRQRKACLHHSDGKAMFYVFRLHSK